MKIEAGLGASDSKDKFDAQDIDDKPAPKFFRKVDNVKNSLIEKLALREAKRGIARHQGHYQLQDRRHAQRSEKVINKVYNGQHWDVEEVKNLHRTTDQLTTLAVKNEVEREQIRRMSVDKESFEAAKPVLKALSHDLRHLVQQSKKAHRKKVSSVINKTEELKALTQESLIHAVKAKQTKQEMEEERKDRIRILNAMLEDDPNMDKETRTMVNDLSKNNIIMDAVRNQITDAQSLIEDGEKEIQEEDENFVKSQMEFVMSDLLYKAKKQEYEAAIEETRIDQIKSETTANRDPIRRQSISQKKEVFSEMFSLFDEAKRDEEEKEEQTIEETKVTKNEVLNEMLFNSQRNKVAKMCAVEKSRRIHEVEHGSNPPDRESVNTIKRMHQELVVRKFSGSLQNPEDVSTAPPEGESAHDQLLRSIRQSARRPSLTIVKE